MRVLIALALLLAAAAPAGAQEFPAVYTEQDVPIVMSDGVTLLADVLRPAQADGSPAPGRFPVLLTQTPYNKRIGKPETPFMVQHGYVQVIADVRGTGSSGGTWESLGEREQRDGPELVAWAAAQPWSTGDVGGHGNSYMAVNQLTTAAQKPPALKALFPIVPMADAYRDVFLTGGQVNTDFLSLWYALVTGAGLIPNQNAPGSVVSHAQGALTFQVANVLEAAAGGDNTYDGPFFRVRSPIEVIDQVDIPAFFVGGWFDLFQRGTPMLAERMRERGVPSGLMIGPWYHNTFGDGLPAAGLPGLEELELRWYDHWLKGRGERPQLPPVSLFENGSGRWRADEAFPPSDVRYRRRHLRPAGSPPDLVVPTPAAGACSRSTAQWTAGTVRAGGLCEEDNRVNDAGSLQFDLPVGKPMELAGPMSARLYVSSERGRDGQLSLRLEDVDPGGPVRQISAGWQVLSLRRVDRSRSLVRDGLLARPFHPFTRASAKAMPADGRPVRVDVEILPGAWRLEPGHTLRLTVQTADTPHLTPPVPQAVASAGGAYRIHHDPRRRSHLVLPVRR